MTSQPSRSIDERHMRAALALGERMLGRTWPNPAVGCVIVKDGRIIARGATSCGGRPHAEANALAEAGEDAAGATAYVTLEPCANWGRTSPCARALIEAGLWRVVVACGDPDPRVDGKGLAWLKDAGLEVEIGILGEEARRQHLGLYRRIQDGRPMVTLKLATSLDGRIATRTGDSRWITGPTARSYGHLLRARHDAILIGSGTALADDPMLTCRLPAMEDRSPVRVVLDRRCRLPADSRLVRTAREVPLWLFTGMPERAAAHAEAGARITAFDGDDLAKVLAELAHHGITRLLVEGGGSIAAGFLSAGLVDRLALLTGTMTIGGDGRPALHGLGLDRLSEAARWQPIESRALGPDHYLLLEPSPS